MNTHSQTGLTPLTRSQRAVVLADGRHLLVGAGAGSGKTSTVVQAICHLLGAAVVDTDDTVHHAEATLRLSDIAAITFTNQAAADLKRKLRAALKRSGLGAIAADVDGARIGTIHAFCGNLLREFALRAGLPPSVAILDDGAAHTLAADCANAAFLEAVTDGNPAELAPLTTGRRTRDIVAAIVQLADNTEQLTAYTVRARSQPESLRDHERLLLALAERAVTLRNEALDRNMEYDFDRMICATRDLLRDHADVRHAVQRQIRVLIVDEFQDVDPAQRDIALLLGGLVAADPKPSRILLIGDPKQSIFRFRRADVTLWNDVAGRFSPSGAAHSSTRNPRLNSTHDSLALELTENFRSRKGILAFVDNVFGTALATPVSETGERMPFEVDYVALEARSEHAEGDRCVELLCVAADESDKAVNATSARVLESQAVAHRMLALRADGKAFGEMAVLVSSWSDVALYEGALRNAGIPVYVLRATGFWESREVIDCIMALNAIRDQHDPVADVASLVGFLKSPFVGVRDDTLLALSQHPEGWRVAMREEPREHALLQRAVDILHRFGEWRDRLPLGEFLHRLVSETGFLSALTLDPTRSAQAIGNVRKLLRLATEARESSLGEWLLEIAEARERADQMPEERLYRERADVVTITSIHSAKGLEWPIVFWCDLMREAPKHTDALALGREQFHWKDVRLVNDKGAVSDPDFDALRDALDLESQAESRRLWYVASTRAKELLVLSGIRLGKVSRGGDSVSGLLTSHFAESLSAAPVPERIAYQHADGTAYELVVNIADAMIATDGDATDMIDVSESERTHAGEGTLRHVDESSLVAPPALVQVAMGRTRLSATQLMRFAESPKDWWWMYAFGFADSCDAATTSEPTGDTVVSAAAGAATRPATDAVPDHRLLIGNIVHHVLERFNYELSDIDELIDQAIVQHDESGADPHVAPSYRAHVRELIDRAIAHPRWQELALNVTSRRELRFTRVLPDGGTLEGAFDIAAVIDDVTHIVDVKTGAGGTASEIAQRYAVQGAVYVDAAQTITGGRAASFELLRFTDPAPVAVPVDVAKVATLVDAIRSSSP